MYSHFTADIDDFPMLSKGFLCCAVTRVAEERTRTHWMNTDADADADADAVPSGGRMKCRENRRGEGGRETERERANDLDNGWPPFHSMAFVSILDLLLLLLLEIKNEGRLNVSEFMLH